MQTELAGSHPDLPIHLLAVNAAGYASGVASMAREADLPLLQDHPDVDVWEKWWVSYRDVVILGRANEQLGVYNLTDHDLSNVSNYGELKQMLVDAARP